jgi:prophage regulatory protein
MPKSEYSLPAEGFVRLQQIIGDRIAKVPGVIPMSATAWYAGIRDGKYPKPVKTGGISLWSVSQIRQFMSDLENGTVDLYADLELPDPHDLEAAALCGMLSGINLSIREDADPSMYFAVDELSRAAWGRHMYFHKSRQGDKRDIVTVEAHIGVEETAAIRAALGAKLVLFERETATAHKGVDWLCALSTSNVRGVL